MALIRVRALEAFEHRGRSYAAGQLIDLPPIEATVLHRRHRVTMTRALTIDPPREISLQEKIPDPPVDAAAEMVTDDAVRRPRRRARTARVEGDGDDDRD